jgi:protein TonB
METLPGAVTPIDQLDSVSRGPGTGPGGGGGRGSGSGQDGEGPGADAGRLGNFGGGPRQPGNGVTSPKLIHEVKPQYTADAVRAKLQGVIEMEAVVLPNGTVDPASIRVMRSLDSLFGLDRQAMKALQEWRFQPGTFKGQPVAVRINVELTFTLR